MTKNIKTNKKNISNKKNDFFDKVYNVVAKIPFGMVTTYGAIAEYCGIKSSARTVGWAINGAKDSGLPCHRVVNRNGELTGKLHFGDPNLMEDLLRSEGIEFTANGKVNMENHFWNPETSIIKRSKKLKHRDI